MTYVIENLPEEVDRALRARAAAENRSIDSVISDAIQRGLKLEPVPVTKKRDLSPIFDGTPLEPAVLEALEAQRTIEPELWE